MRISTIVFCFAIAFVSYCQVLAQGPVNSPNPDNSMKLLTELANAKSPLLLEGEITTAILKTSNGCGIGNYMIPSTGDTSQGYPPVIGALKDGFPNSQWAYDVLDTLPGTQIKGVAFTREVWPENTSIVSGGAQNPYVVVTDAGMYSYWIPQAFSPWGDEVFTLDSISISGITKMAGQVTTDKSDPVVLYVEDSTDHYSIRVYSYPGLLEQFRFPFHFEPEVFEIADDGIFITGWDTNGSYSLYHYSTLQNSLIATYPLNESASNAQEFLKMGDSLLILSSPGDSITRLSLVLSPTGTLSQSTIYSPSGARATYNEYKTEQKFTFQPVVDPNSAYLEKQILIYDPVTTQLDTFQTDLHLDYFKHPREENMGFGYFNLEWMGAKWEGTNSDTVYLSDFSIPFKVNAGAVPDFINATFGCWVSILEEHEKINFDVYPNPASENVTINLTGLEKGNLYELEILDMTGRLHYSLSLEAYQKLQLPLQDLEKGTYILKLDTGKNIIARKLVLQ